MDPRVKVFLCGTQVAATEQHIASLTNAEIFLFSDIRSLTNDQFRELGLSMGLRNRIIRLLPQEEAIQHRLHSHAKTGKRPYPPRSMSASWAMQSLVAIPRRTIVRAFIACGILEQALACPLTPCPPAPLHSPCAATLAHTYTVACPLCFVCRRTSQSLRMPPSA